MLSLIDEANRHKPSQRITAETRWSMFRILHAKVSALLEEDDLHFDFCKTDSGKNCSNTYDTNIMGRFECPNVACTSAGWPSKKIAITIRMYPGARYNARVYHQRCKKCKSLGRPYLDSSYEERVAYRLKKWCGIEQDQPSFHGRSKGPHQRELCEGCRDGHCNQL